MGTLSSHLADEATIRQIYLQRVGKSEAKKLGLILKRMEKRILHDLASNPTPTTIADRRLMLSRIRSIAKSVFDKHDTQLLLDMKEIVAIESDFAVTLLSGAVNVDVIRPSKVQLQSAIETPIGAPIGRSISITTALNNISKNQTNEIVQFMRDGFVTGRTNQDMASEVQGLLKVHQRQADALVRTTTNHMAAQARRITEEANSDIVDGFEVVATLDSRTTLICAGLDGKIFPLNAQRPPYHWGCRTTTIPHVKEEYRKAIPITGKRVSVGADGKRQVGGDVTYSGWLKRQPAAFQDDVLGKARGALFRRGKLPIEKFTDRRGATLTLDQLRKKNPGAFEKANLN